MTDDELEAIDARARAASNAPWKVVKGEYDGADWLVATLGSDGLDGLDRTVTTDHVHASDLRGGAAEDAEFIAHARHDVPALIAEVKRLWGKVSRPTCPACYPGFGQSQLCVRHAP